jgi:hypothetical protein
MSKIFTFGASYANSLDLRPYNRIKCSLAHKIIQHK